MFKVVKKNGKIKILQPGGDEEFPHLEFDDDYRLILKDSSGKSKVVKASDLSDDDLLLGLKELGKI